MEILIAAAIAVATLPAMLFQTISTPRVRWVLIGGLLALGLGMVIALPMLEQGEILFGETALTKVNIIPIMIGYLVALNFLVLPMMYWIDKRRAILNGARGDKKNQRERVPEFSMHFLTSLGGAFGAFTSQQIFRHKRSKGSFQLMFFFTILTSMAIYYVLWIAVEPDLARVDAWMKSTGLFRDVDLFSGI